MAVPRFGFCFDTAGRTAGNEIDNRQREMVVTARASSSPQRRSPVPRRHIREMSAFQVAELLADRVLASAGSRGETAPLCAVAVTVNLRLRHFITPAAITICRRVQAASGLIHPAHDDVVFAIAESRHSARKILEELLLMIEQHAYQRRHEIRGAIREPARARCARRRARRRRYQCRRHAQQQQPQALHAEARRQAFREVPDAGRRLCTASLHRHYRRGMHR